MVDRAHIFRFVFILVVLIGGMFVFAYLKSTELKQQETLVPTTEQKQEDSPFAYITRVDAKHFFENGTHTLVGEILMPTPCDLLSWETHIQESSPETVHILFSVINTTETCSQVVTPQRFKISFEATEGARMKAFFLGREIEINLIPALPGEKPEDFELFIKG